MKLTKNFSLKEMTKTDTGLSNKPTERTKDNLFFLCTYLLQPIRNRWGRTTVNSGLRVIAVNTAVGGSDNSEHIEGKAGDIDPAEAGIKEVFNWIMASDLKYGQLIYEKRGDVEWIHISLPRKGKPNGQNLSIIDGVRTKVTAPL
ncbi:MAG: peptidase M15 [Deltaproteobacteria bacterium]|nr:peptidase M15 [Deltaproteobacteria bacterium]